MIDESNTPIVRNDDGTYTIMVNGRTYGVADNNPAEAYTIAMVEAYIKDHPEALRADHA